MMKLSVKMSGLQNVQNELNNLITPGKINNTLEKAAILVEAEAKRLCPVGAPFGGRLLQSIQRYKSGELQWTIAANADYAEYIEYGTSRIAVGTPEDPLVYTSGSGKYPSYRPFLRAALYGSINQINELFNQMMK